MSGQPVINDIEIIYVNLLQEPALSLKTNSDFGTLPNNTFLQFENASFEDLIGIPNVENISQASDVTPDETKASIESFTLDLNTAQLLLTFDDVVDSSTGIFTGITIQESQQGNLRVPLTGGTVISPSGYVIIILLESDDVILLKSISGLATSRANTYLVINEDTFKDAAARNIIGIPSNEALQVDPFIPDRTSPLLIDFSLDMNSNELVITFNEPIEPSSIIFTRLILLNSSSNSTSLASVTLSTPISSVPSNEFTVFSITLNSTSDIERIKSQADLATSVDNTFIQVLDEAFVDMALLGNQANQSLNSIIQASIVLPDTVAPSLVSFISVDLNQALITLLYTEPVDVQSIDFTKFRLQNSFEVDFGLVSSFLTLTDGICLSSFGCNPGSELTFKLVEDDLNQLKSRPGLCISKQTCIPTFTSKFHC